jgi:hypothetical protein
MGLNFPISFLVNRPKVTQGCTRPGHQVVVVNICLLVAPNICGSLLWNLLYLTFLGIVF